MSFRACGVVGHPALDRVVSEGSERIEPAYGRGAIAVLLGAQPDDREDVSGRQVRARGCSEAAAHRLQRPAVHGVGRAPPTRRLVRRGPRRRIPWSDILETDVVLVAGSNVAECVPYDELNTSGEPTIAGAPDRRRSARTRSGSHADLPAGLGRARIPRLFDDVLRRAARWACRLDVHRQPHTIGWSKFGAEVRGGSDRGRRSELTGVDPRRRSRRSLELVAEADRAMVMHCPRRRAPLAGGRATSMASSTWCSRREIGRSGAGCGTITGQGNGQGGHEHGQKCDQLPGQRSITIRGAPAYVAAVWGSSPRRPAG